MKLSNGKIPVKYYPARFGGILLCVVLLILLSAPTTSLAQQDGISIGDTVEVTAGEGLRFRAEPGTSTEVITKLPYGTRMKVVGGPKANLDGYTWWELEGDAGRGWAAENFLRVVDARQVTVPSSESSGCEQPYPPIQYCPQKDESIYAVLIDLNNPHIRFETVMADINAEHVNNAAQEFVSVMGNRLEGEGAVAVINADYFDLGGDHGPEGFTVVNGVRLDGKEKGDGDNMSIYRSSIAFSKSKLDGGNSPIAVGIQRFKTDAFSLNGEKMFNAIGGGPQIVFNGAWDWARGSTQSAYDEYPECPSDFLDNDVINGECFRNTGDWDSEAKMWTVLGKTADGQLLMLLAKYPDIKPTLEKYQIQEAIKLDGGGSSQLWFSNYSIVPGDGRKVANGLAVFYKNDYRVQEQTQWPVVVSGESLNVQVILRNMGADTWTKQDYAISSTKNPWDMSLQFELPTAVGPGGSITWTWTSEPITKAWGIYEIELQLVDDGKEFPTDPIRIQVIVIPKELADKKTELEQQIRDWIEQGKQDIEQRVLNWIKKKLNNWFQNCLNTPLTLVPIVFMLVYNRNYKNKRLRTLKE